MKKRMLFLSFLFLSLAAWALEPTHLRVHRTDGNVLNAQLDKQLVLDFLEENVAYYLALKQADSADVQIALAEIQKMTFGIEEIPDVPTAVETLSYGVSNQDDVRKVLENGQLIIIRNGVRYNIFGMRL